jgi:hypothetical protein
MRLLLADKKMEPKKRKIQDQMQKASPDWGGLHTYHHETTNLFKE